MCTWVSGLSHQAQLWPSTTIARRRILRGPIAWPAACGACIHACDVSHAFSTLHRFLQEQASATSPSSAPLMVGACSLCFNSVGADGGLHCQYVAHAMLTRPVLFLRHYEHRETPNRNLTPHLCLLCTLLHVQHAFQQAIAELQIALCQGLSVSARLLSAAAVTPDSQQNPPCKLALT